MDSIDHRPARDVKSFKGAALRPATQALYSRAGYVEYDRRPAGAGGGALIYMRKALG